MRVFFRVSLPILFFLTSVWCAYCSAFCAWAHTAAPHEHNSYYERWYLIWAGFALIAFLLIFMSIYLLRPRTNNVEQAGGDQPPTRSVV